MSTADVTLIPGPGFAEFVEAIRSLPPVLVREDGTPLSAEETEAVLAALAKPMPESP